MDMREYGRAFEEIEREFEETVSTFGLSFEKVESTPRDMRANKGDGDGPGDTKSAGEESTSQHIEPESTPIECCDNTTSCASSVKTPIHVENNRSSLWTSWISPACVACRTGERTATFFVSLACTRDCYFCFNPNQEDYGYFRTHTRDIVSELDEAAQQGAVFDYLAITGGEPCLHQKEVLEFIERAKQLYPQVHIRIYTSGDLLDDRFLHQMADAGLDEIRFSIKPDEVEDVAIAQVMGRIDAALTVIPAVMVEMPVIPGTYEDMKALLLELDKRGVHGINLLEFCFPLSNASAFKQRGFRLRKHPYQVLYNYWYAGGLPVAGSEKECLELVRFASDRNLELGVHYCSLDNKNTGQVYQQNRLFRIDKGFAENHPFLTQDEHDHFLKCAKVFGDDVEKVRAGFSETPAGFVYDPAQDMLSFPLERVPEILKRYPSIEIAIALFVIEAQEGKPVLREVQIVPYED